VTLSLAGLLSRAETQALAVVAALGGLLKLPVFAAAFAALWETAGAVFAPVALAAFTLAPRVAFLPEQPLTVAALLIGSIVLLKRGRDAVRSFIERFRDET